MLTASLALRFLRSKKSHGAVSAVAIVSIIGVAIATAAIVCVLSVFNGFREVLTSKLDTFTPDITLLPRQGKTIINGDSLVAAISADKRIDAALPVVEDQALALWKSMEMPVMLRGVDINSYRRMTLLDSLTVAEENPAFRILAGRGEATPTEAVASIGTVVGLGSPAPGETVTIFAPRRIGRVNIANPLSSFYIDSVRLTTVYESKRTDFDRNVLIVPIEVARDLFQYDNEATQVLINVKKGEDPGAVIADMKARTGDSYEILDRMQSRQDNYRMVNIEKWVTFLLLIFILMIAGFNIISTLSMLVLEKNRQLTILYSMGLSRRQIGNIFAWESFFVTVAGGFAGILLGVGLCLLQEHYGLLRLGGDPSTLIMTAYPVKVEFSDLLTTLLPIAFIGAVTALSASGFASKRVDTGRI